MSPLHKYLSTIIPTYLGIFTHVVGRSCRYQVCGEVLKCGKQGETGLFPSESTDSSSIGRAAVGSVVTNQLQYLSTIAYGSLCLYRVEDKSSVMVEGEPRQILWRENIHGTK